jgi:hypothetical protein
MENSHTEQMPDLNERVVTRGVHPTSTVSQSRLPVACGQKRIATQKMREINEVVEIENSHGKLSYNKNRLTQVHRDIMDWIFAFHRNYEVVDGYPAASF